MKSIITHTATQPTVESLTDYYPFGMVMPGRSYNAYRYGFNSQENVPDQEYADASLSRIESAPDGTVNREYSWHYFNHTFTVFNKGMAFDPNSENEASVPSLISHSHPSTDFSKCLSWDPALETLSVNTKMLFRQQWVQPPSSKDIKNALYEDGSTQNKYVWGMGDRTLYIYDATGVIASVPFRVYCK